MIPCPLLKTKITMQEINISCFSFVSPDQTPHWEPQLRRILGQHIPLNGLWEVQITTDTASRLQVEGMLQGRGRSC